MAGIEVSSLGALRFLAKGGLGVVHRVGSTVLPEGPMVFKEIRPDVDPGKAAWLIKAMQAAVDFRDALSVEDRADLDLYTLWPRAMVYRSGSAVGCLLPLMPDDYYAGRNRTEMQLGWLTARDTLCEVNGVDATAFANVGVRLSLIRQLVYAVGRLHKHGWVYGDLSAKNVVFALDPPRILLLDCDGTASSSNPDRFHFQGHSAAMAPPECASSKTLQDSRSDVYKLALLSIRSLSRGEGAVVASTTTHLTGILSADALNALDLCLGPPGHRLSAKKLFEALTPD